MVNDDERLLHTLSMLLKSAGHAVTEAQDMLASPVGGGPGTGVGAGAWSIDDN